MLLRRCGESGRASRALTERGRRYRRRDDATRLMVWHPRGEDAAVDLLEPSEPSASQPVRAPTRPTPLPARPPELTPVGPSGDSGKGSFGEGPFAEGPFGQDSADGPSSAGLTWLWQVLGHSSAAREQWAELLRLAATSADTPVRAETLNLAGRFAGTAGDLGTAHAFFQEALIAGRAGQNAASVACSLCGLARVSIERGAFDLARTLQEEALELQRRLGQAGAAAGSLAILGWLTVETRGVRQAETLHEEALTLRVTLGDPLPLAYSLIHLGWLAHLTDRPEMARRHLAEALTTVRGCPDRWKVVALLALLGRPSAVETPAHHAIRLLTGAETLETDASAGMGGERVTVSASGGLDGGATSAFSAMTVAAGDLGVDAAGALAEARNRLAPRSLAIALGGGGQVEADGLVEQALQAAEAHAQRQHATLAEPPERMLLTPRELEVAALIGRGHTNRRIAEDLVIAERTAETHARNIREKLGLSSRAQIAAWVASRGLLAVIGRNA